jgi:small redox-active disulfide protein 2
MKKIKILGSGCAKCKKMAEVAESVARDMGIEISLEKITDIKKIVEFGVMTTPVLIVDDEIKIAGVVPTIFEMKKAFE